MKKIINKILRKSDKNHYVHPPEFSHIDIEIIDHVLNNELTMVGPSRLIATIQACKHVIENDIPGDFVECGVWRGGNAIAAKLVFEAYNSDKTTILFDTFAGMTTPTTNDKKTLSGRAAIERFNKKQKDEHNEWCYASIEDVQQNFINAGANLDEAILIQGDVLQTLESEKNIPENISVLRLDTDWYESTLKEAQVLYPKLSRNGVLIIDDYGDWDGSRKAIEEYFQNSKYQRPFLQHTDYSGRMGMKTE